jgi:hypothetical protein
LWCIAEIANGHSNGAGQNIEPDAAGSDRREDIDLFVTDGIGDKESLPGSSSPDIDISYGTDEGTAHRGNLTRIRYYNNLLGLADHGAKDRGFIRLKRHIQIPSATDFEIGSGGQNAHSEMSGFSFFFLLNRERNDC